MKFNEFVFSLCDFAPIAISDALCKMENMYDNSGVIVPTDRDVKKALFCLDLTFSALEEAQKRDCQVIVTHHPSIYTPIKAVDGAILKAATLKIGVVSMHLNYDCAEYGIDHFFALGLGAKSYETITHFEKFPSAGYGRVFKTNKTALEILNAARLEFETDKIELFGDKNKQIKTVASFCGEGLSEEIAKTIDADLLCSADIRHHIILKALERGKCVLQFSHYGSENYGLKRIYRHFLENKRFFNQVEIFYFDDKRFV